MYRYQKELSANKLGLNLIHKSAELKSSPWEEGIGNTPLMLWCGVVWWGVCWGVYVCMWGVGLAGGVLRRGGGMLVCVWGGWQDEGCV